ncbi:MAG TPA: hypothetical protein VFF06_06730 [Polyangia bacterium]|nr:hypothetical protein [Polyangia bacterium]
MRARLWLLGVVAACGCNNPTYLSERRPLETKPAAMGGGFQADLDLYVLPVRRPNGAERQAMQAETTKLGLMMPVPWAGTRDFDIEIEWSLKNLDTMPVHANFQLNGGNEFGDYVPSLYIDPTANPEDQTPPPPLLAGSPIDLAAGEVREGVLREDDLKEAALNLEAITRYPDPAGVLATPFMVIEHSSQLSPIGRASVPKNDVTPAMVRYAFSLTADGHVAFDYTVRVRDYSGKLASPDQMNLWVNTAAMLAPPAAPPAMMMPAAPAGM